MTLRSARGRISSKKFTSILTWLRTSSGSGLSAGISPEAREDLAAGIEWYAERSILAAERFLDEVDRALALITEAPERSPFHLVGTRHFVLTSFPYSIVYRVSPTLH